MALTPGVGGSEPELADSESQEMLEEAQEDRSESMKSETGTDGGQNATGGEPSGLEGAEEQRTEAMKQQEKERQKLKREGKERQEAISAVRRPKDLRELSEGPQVKKYETRDSGAKYVPTYAGGYDRALKRQFGITEGEWEKRKTIQEAVAGGEVNKITRADIVKGAEGANALPAPRAPGTAPRYTLAKGLGEYTREEFEEEIQPIFGVSEEKYEKAAALKTAERADVAEKTKKGYKLTKTPSELSEREKQLAEEAGFKMPEEGVSQKIYEWAQKGGESREKLGEFGAMLTGTAVGTVAGPVGFVESYIPGEQPGEEYFTEAQRVTPTALIEKENIKSPVTKASVYAGGAGAGIATGAAVGAGVGAVGGAAVEAVPVSLPSTSGIVSSASSEAPTAVSAWESYSSAVGTGARYAPLAAAGGVEGAKAYSKYEAGEPIEDIIGGGGGGCRSSRWFRYGRRVWLSCG